MTCGSAREAILDLARNVAMSGSVRAAAEQHLRECASCAAEFERQRDLTAALGALAAEAEAWVPSQGIEERLHAAGQPAPPVRRPPSRASDRWIYALVTAAVIAAVAWLGSHPSTGPSTNRGASTTASRATSTVVSSPPATQTRRLESSVVEANVDTRGPSPVHAAAGSRRATPPKQARSFEFMTLPGAAALPDLESGSVVRIAVPVGALPEYGLEIVPLGAKTTVDADVLVGQDGVARAIRLVSDEESATQDTRSRR